MEPAVCSAANPERVGAGGIRGASSEHGPKFAFGDEEEGLLQGGPSLCDRAGNCVVVCIRDGKVDRGVHGAAHGNSALLSQKSVGHGMSADAVTCSHGYVHLVIPLTVRLGVAFSRPSFPPGIQGSVTQAVSRGVLYIPFDKIRRRLNHDGRPLCR